MEPSSNFTMLGALLPTVTLLIALPLSVYSNLTPTLERRDSTIFQDVCIEIASKISDASGVFYRGESKNNMLYFFDTFEGNPTYERDIFHWANSSAEFSACTVEPGTTADVGEVVRTEALPLFSFNFTHTLYPKVENLGTNSYSLRSKSNNFLVWICTQSLERSKAAAIPEILAFPLQKES